MIADQIPELLQWSFGVGWALVAILFVAGILTGGRTRRFNRAWKPLLKVMRGKVKHNGASSTLRGTYNDLPVRATISKGNKKLPDTFTLEISGGKGGRDWEVAHRSEKPLGPDVWRLFTNDPALQTKMEAAGIPACMRDWPEHAVVRYDSGDGALTLTEQIFAPPAGHFRAQLGLLEAFEGVNRRVNAD